MSEKRAGFGSFFVCAGIMQQKSPRAGFLFWRKRESRENEQLRPKWNANQQNPGRHGGLPAERPLGL